MRQFLSLSLGLILLFSSTILPATAVAQQSAVRVQTVQPRPTNLDFEQGSVGQVPDGWACPTNVNYAAQLTEEGAQAGKRATLLQSIPASATGTPFGNLMQAFDATPFRGRRVRFRAFVRTETGSRAQLWLRVDRTGDKRGFFDNMGDRPITSGEWRAYEIKGEIDDDAETISIGMIMLGSGKAWIDTASFEDLGKVIVVNDPPRALTPRGLENLVAFTRLLGYVRHFHPSDEAAATNWDTFAIQSVNQVEGAKGPKELAQLLQNIFAPVAPTVRVFSTGKTPNLPAELSTSGGNPALKIVSWKHKGFGPAAGQRSAYASERVRVDAPDGKVPTGSPDPHEPFRADLGAGVSCLVPLALFADAKGTLPHATTRPIAAKELLIKHTGNERATRLADVALAWNILQHFYPYFDVVRTDWPRALSEALASAAIDETDRTFALTLRRMIAQLHDGHGNVYFSGESNDYVVPVVLGLVEGQLVITDVSREDSSGLQRGDLVLRIDGQPSLEAISAKEFLISAATPQWRRYVAVNSLMMGAKDSEISFEIQNSAGAERTVKLRRTVELQNLAETRPAKIAELKPGIFYVALDRIKDEDFQAALPQLEKAKGIIFELRGYPSVSPAIISHLIDQPVQSARWMIPIITTPDHAHIVDYDTSGRWDLKPIAPRLKAKLAFLTDGRAISYAESYMGIVEAYKLADIVGEPTAGTNGNINPFTLVGGYTVIWTGMKVLKHDGSQHHGVGIKPTVPVSRTIKGIREGRDEQLERAISVVSQ